MLLDACGGRRGSDGPGGRQASLGAGQCAGLRLRRPAGVAAAAPGLPMAGWNLIACILDEK